MPIPLLVAAVWGTAAYVGCKSQKEVQEKKEEYNKICSQIETETNSMKNLAENTYNSYSVAVSNLDTLRRDTFNGPLTDFVNTFNQIKNKVNLNDDLNYLPEIRNDFQIDKYSAEENYIHRSDAFASPLLAGGVAVAFGAIGGGLMFIQGKMKKAQIMGKIDEANTKLCEVHAEAEKVKLRCTELEYNRKQLELYHNTFSTLGKIVEKGNQNLKQIINKKGTDYNNYSKKTQADIRSISNLAKLMRDFVKEDIIDEQGDICSAAQQRFEDCKNELQSYYPKYAKDPTLAIADNGMQYKSGEKNVKEIILNIIIFTVATFLNSLIGIISPIVSFIYARKRNLIMTILLLIGNLVVPDPIPFADEILQIIMVLYVIIKNNGDNKNV